MNEKPPCVACNYKARIICEECRKLKKLRLRCDMHTVDQFGRLKLGLCDDCKEKQHFAMILS